MIIDIFVLAILAIGTLIGKIRGLNSCLISIISLFLSIILATMLCRPLAEFLIDNTNMDEDIKSGIIKTTSFEKFEVKDLEKYPKTIRKYVDYVTEGVNSAGETIKENIATHLAEQSIFAISYIMIIILTKILLLIIKIISKILEKIPVIKQANEIGGAICGFIESALLIYIVIAIISVCSPMIKDSWIVSEINQSYVTKIIYDNNILANNMV